MLCPFLIVGPQGSGKGLLHDVMSACPDLPQPGSFTMQSAPAKRLRTAAGYIVVYREMAPYSIASHNWRTMTADDACQVVARGREQINDHIAGAPWIMVNYRDVVGRIEFVVSKIAEFVGVAPWVFDGHIFDGDRRHG